MKSAPHSPAAMALVLPTIMARGAHRRPRGAAELRRHLGPGGQRKATPRRASDAPPPAPSHLASSAAAAALPPRPTAHARPAGSGCGRGGRQQAEHPTAQQLRTEALLTQRRVRGYFFFPGLLLAAPFLSLLVLAPRAQGAAFSPTKEALCTLPLRVGAALRALPLAPRGWPAARRAALPFSTQRFTRTFRPCSAESLSFRARCTASVFCGNRHTP